MELLLSFFIYFNVCDLVSSTSSKCFNKTGQCDQITVRWLHKPPYIYTDNEGEMVGILPNILEELITSCCGECQEWNYLQAPVSDETALLSDKMNGSVFNVPVVKSMETKEIGRFPYFPLVESPGLLYIIQSKKDLDVTVSNAILEAVKESWPVMIFAYLAAAVSGIIVWALDSYWNPHQFPSNFFKGSWDGFWWACVSMTTVGYGDRTPKSFSARLFTFVWVLVGLVVIAMFNANMTTTLTSIVMTANARFSGEEIAITKESPEQRYALTRNVQIKAVKDFKAITTLLKNTGEKTRGALLDAYVAGYHADELDHKKGFRVAEIIEHYEAYGIYWTNHNTNDDKEKEKKLRQCIIRYSSLNQMRINEIVQRNSKTLKIPDRSISSERSTSLIDVSYPWYIESVCVASGFILLFLLFGALRSLWKKRKSNKVHTERQMKKEEDLVEVPAESSMEELLVRQCKEMEKLMEWEVDNFIRTWSKKKNEILDFTSNYSKVKDPYAKSCALFQQKKPAAQKKPAVRKNWSVLKQRQSVTINSSN